jgi:hypothetical protein
MNPVDARRLRFDGHIVGVGTSEGTRVVVGRWQDTPWGPFADVMVEQRDGTRILLAPHEPVAQEIAATYVFDAVHVVPVVVALDRERRTWRVRAGPLDLTIGIGARTAVGEALRLVPAPLAGLPATATMMGPVARLAVPGVRTHGRARAGREEWYSARDQHAISALSGRWGERDLGELRDVDPPTRFGFSSTPRRPAVTRITTTVEHRTGH